MSQAVEVGNMIYRPETYRDGRPCITEIKRAGKGRSRFAPAEGTLVPVKTILYRDTESRDKALADRQASADEWNRQKTLRRQERSKPHSLKVGDVMVSSWGWEQTNVDWYTVTATTPHTVELARIAGHVTQRDGYSSMAGFSTPEAPVRIVGDERSTHRVGPDGAAKLTSYSWANPWDGRERYTSWYA